MADKQKLIQNNNNSGTDYTPCVAVAGDGEAAAPHIVVDVDNDQKEVQQNNDKSPLI